MGAFPRSSQAAFTCSLCVPSFLPSHHPIIHKATPVCFKFTFIAHSSLVWHKSRKLRNFLRLKRQSEVCRYAEAHMLGPHSYLPKAGSLPWFCPPHAHWLFSSIPHPSPGRRLQTGDIHNQQVRQSEDVLVWWPSWHHGLLVPALSNYFSKMEEQPWSLRECLK